MTDPALIVVIAGGGYFVLAPIVRAAAAEARESLLTPEQRRERAIDAALEQMRERYLGSPLDEPDWIAFERDIAYCLREGCAPIPPPPKPSDARSSAGWTRPTRRPPGLPSPVPMTARQQVIARAIWGQQRAAIRAQSRARAKGIVCPSCVGAGVSPGKPQEICGRCGGVGYQPPHEGE